MRQRLGLAGEIRPGCNQLDKKGVEKIYSEVFVSSFFPDLPDCETAKRQSAVRLHTRIQAVWLAAGLEQMTTCFWAMQDARVPKFGRHVNNNL